MHILQISDIHIHINNFQTKRLRHSFINKISELNNAKKYDYIFITGDISHQGRGFNIDSINFIQSLLSTLNLSLDRLIIIPGNHDISRNPARSELIEKIKEHDNPSDYLDELLMDPKQKGILLSSFNEFDSFIKQVKNTGYLEGGIHQLIELEKMNLVLCNTNLICNSAGEEGSLLIGKNELFECLQKSSQQKTTIALGHHTLNCLTPEEKSEVLSMFDDFNINLYLSGHVHAASYKLEADYYNEILMIVCSGLHFDGYTQSGFVDIFLDTSSFYITQYIWNYEHKYWTINNNLGRRMENGTLIHTYEKLTSPQTSQLNLIKNELSTLFDENERIWKQYGPQSLTALNNPLSDLHKIWKMKCIEEIIPNNDKILAIINENIKLVSNEKKYILDLYKNHIEGFKNNHLSDYPSQDVPRFPKEIKSIFDNEGEL